MKITAVFVKVLHLACILASIIISTMDQPVNAVTSPPTSSPPPSPPPPSATTSPPYCTGPRGEIIEGLLPGGRWTSQDGCELCTCRQNGKATCLSASCMPPECADMVTQPGVCCPTCPNGLTCRTPGGSIVKKGEYLREGQLNCTCFRGVSPFTRPTDGPGPSATCFPLSDECEDSSNQCRFWAYNGECRVNSGWMLRNCRKSCAVCEGVCEDSSPNCPQWSAEGYCGSNPVWMLDNCPLSCRACAPRNDSVRENNSVA